MSCPAISAMCTAFVMTAVHRSETSAGGAPLLISDANSAIEAVCGTTSSDTDVSVHYYTITN